MESHLSIDLDKLTELNGSKVDALFKYLKVVSRNKTPVLIKGVKEKDYWNCNFYECQIPASHFTDIKIPALKDNNPDGTETLISLSDKLLTLFTPGTEYIFKDSKTTVRSGSSRVELANIYSQETLQENLETYLEVLQSDVSNANTTFIVKPESKIINVLAEISNSPEGCIFVSDKYLTVLNGSVLFRFDNDCEFKSTDNNLYINMYTANKILSTLSYCDEVELKLTSTHTVILGYIIKDGVKNLLVKNVSAIFETDNINIEDEDLKGLIPTNTNQINLKLQDLVTTLTDKANMIATFSKIKNLEVGLYKNGNGVSLNVNSGDESHLIINVGDVAEQEPEVNVFTSFVTVLPLMTMKSLMEPEAEIKITYDNEDCSAVSFESGNVQILSGKLF